MSIVVDPLKPHKYPEPPRRYPDWLAKSLVNPNSPIPASVIEENRPKIEPTLVATPAKIFGDHGVVTGLYVPPPMVVEQLGKIPITFRVLTAFDKPISGLHLRANGENWVTNEKGEVSIEAYKGHLLDFSIGLNGWHIPNGAKRRVRLNNLVPMTNIFPVSAPTTIVLYPQSGEFKVNGQTFSQSIIYDTA